MQKYSMTHGIKDINIVLFSVIFGVNQLFDPKNRLSPAKIFLDF